MNRAVYVAFFAILFIAILFLDRDLYPYRSLVSLYILLALISGYVFRNHFYLRAAVAVSLTFFRYFLSPDGFPEEYELLLVQLFSFLFTSEAIARLLNHRDAEKNNLIEMITVLAKSLDSRDKYTARHSQSVAAYALLLAEELNLPKKQRDSLYIGGLVHDIGKIGVPEAVLTKNDRLTDDEYEQIKQHPVIGYEMLQHIKSFSANGVLDMVLHHHERYDGRGYPHGLYGEKIPYEARIMAVADTFDAMTSRRVYRDRLPLEHVIAEIEKNAGTQFDPEIARVFVEILKRYGEDIFEYAKRERKS